jgi:RNA-binding protein
MPHGPDRIVEKKPDAADIRALKKRAHHLDVVVQTGAAGLTDAVTAEIDNALTAHELIKIRLVADSRADRKEMITFLCDSLQAVNIQQIGHVCVLYRARPEDDAGAG